MNPLAQTLKALAAILERLSIAYVIGGSVASSARGEYRATNDLDLVAAVVVGQTDRLAAELGADWYADPCRAGSEFAMGTGILLVPHPKGYAVPPLLS